MPYNFDMLGKYPILMKIEGMIFILRWTFLPKIIVVFESTISYVFLRVDNIVTRDLSLLDMWSDCPQKMMGLTLPSLLKVAVIEFKQGT